MSDFYQSYNRFKNYQTPTLSAKIEKRFDIEVWRPAACNASQRFLELGCGTGQFLAYLAAKGVTDAVGIDHDPELGNVIPQTAKPFFRQGDIIKALEGEYLGLFDRVFLFDVLEHFTPEEGWKLLEAVRRHLKPGGLVLVKVPNAASPWGIQFHFGDFTHKVAYSPHSLRQMAETSGFELVRFYTPYESRWRRRMTETLLHKLLAWALTMPPDLLSANMYGLLKPRGQ